MITKSTTCDVAVIGGGAAGMIASGRSAELGAKVFLIEKNEKLGKKLSITGKGRCNITNAEFDFKKLASNYGKNGRFLFSVFSRFTSEDAIDFFEKKGVKTKIERGNRVFPLSDKSGDVINALTRYLKEGNVEIIYGKKVEAIKEKNKRIEEICIEGKKIIAKNYIITTGGLSYPLTGSTGDGYSWAEKFGHSIIEPKPVLTPIKLKNRWIKELQGLSLKNVELSVLQKGKKIDYRFGEMLFTHFGISGPIVLDISKLIGKLLDTEDEITLSLDLKPALDLLTLDKRIQKDFQKYNNKIFKNSLDDLLPKKLIKVILELSEINQDKPVNLITKEERKKLCHILKNLEMNPCGLMGFDIAIATSGGICLNEVDPKTMRSKIISNLFFAGEILDIDGPTGGFNLQSAWSTGYVAGENATLPLIKQVLI